jgi:hypothetical protein
MRRAWLTSMQSQTEARPALLATTGRASGRLPLFRGDEHG